MEKKNLLNEENLEKVTGGDNTNPLIARASVIADGIAVAMANPLAEQKIEKIKEEK